MIVLYELTEDGPRRSAELTPTPDRGVEIRVLQSSTVTDRLRLGVLSHRLARVVLPAEGSVYLDALQASLARSTYWYTREED